MEPFARSPASPPIGPLPGSVPPAPGSSVAAGSVGSVAAWLWVAPPPGAAEAPGAAAAAPDEAAAAPDDAAGPAELPQPRRMSIIASGRIGTTSRLAMPGRVPSRRASRSRSRRAMIGSFRRVAVVI
jgi:hypothetical protein